MVISYFIEVSVDKCSVCKFFYVVADKLPAKAFFMGLVDGTRYNMVVNPNVDGVISLNLKMFEIPDPSGKLLSRKMISGLYCSHLSSPEYNDKA